MVWVAAYESRKKLKVVAEVREGLLRKVKQRVTDGERAEPTALELKTNVYGYRRAIWMHIEIKTGEKREQMAMNDV